MRAAARIVCLLLAAECLGAPAALGGNGTPNRPPDQLWEEFPLIQTTTQPVHAGVRPRAGRPATPAPSDEGGGSFAPGLQVLMLLGAGGAIAALSVLLLRARPVYSNATVAPPLGRRVRRGGRAAAPDGGRAAPGAKAASRVQEWLARGRSAETAQDEDAADQAAGEVVELPLPETEREARARAENEQLGHTLGDVSRAVSALKFAADPQPTPAGDEENRLPARTPSRQPPEPAPRRSGRTPARASDVVAAPDHVARNRAAWQRWARAHASAGRDAWQKNALGWGIWGIPESELRLLADLERGQDVVELGCGSAEVSAWLARLGLRPVAVDIAPAQIEAARVLQREFGLSFPLVCADAERLQLDDASFDVALSEYGASLWCDPQRWLPEAHRLLRPDGRLIFFANGALLMACTPPDGGRAGERLVRDYFGAGRVEFEEGGAVEFHLTHGEWVRVLRESGFVVEDLVEVRPPPGGTPRYDFASVDWARRWPSEEIWIARKAG